MIKHPIRVWGSKRDGRRFWPSDTLLPPHPQGTAHPICWVLEKAFWHNASEKETPQTAASAAQGWQCDEKIPYSHKSAQIGIFSKGISSGKGEVWQKTIRVTKSNKEMRLVRSHLDLAVLMCSSRAANATVTQQCVKEMILSRWALPSMTQILKN